MADNMNQMPRSGGQRPMLRCPVCSTMVELPAITCPKCNTNLRTGYTPPDSSLFGRGRLIFGGLVLVLVIIAAVAVMFFNKEEPYTAPVPTPASGPGTTDLNEAVETVQSIAESNARIVAGPTDAKPILDMTRDVADKAMEKQHMAEDLAKGKE